MRLFISYARVDKPLCRQLVRALVDVHDVWFDERLFAGMNWWQEIQTQIQAAEGFVYLLSPESVQSEYCRREYELAVALDKTIIPVLIQSNTQIPADLNIIHYADLTQDITDSVEVLKALTLAERNIRDTQPIPAAMPAVATAATSVPVPGGVDRPAPAASVADIPSPLIFDQESRLGVQISQATQLIAQQEYDRAAFILHQMQQNQSLSGQAGAVVQHLLDEAENRLRVQAYKRSIAHQYDKIVSLITDSAPETKQRGCTYFWEFHQAHPDYDPDHVADYCAEVLKITDPAKRSPPLPTFLPEPFEWCSIPAGETTLQDASGQILPGTAGGPQAVAAFFMSKYPITYGQYVEFLSAEDGYANLDWWDFSTDACQWAAANSNPALPPWETVDLPMGAVSWYDAVAFCRWLSAQLGYEIRLPTEAQWQRTAQGDTTTRYPWGPDFEEGHCHAGAHEGPVAVTACEAGASAAGVQQLSGNVREWCSNEWVSGETHLSGSGTRALRGGAWSSPPGEVTALHRTYAPPWLSLPQIGFRVVTQL